MIELNICNVYHYSILLVARIVEYHKNIMYKEFNIPLNHKNQNNEDKNIILKIYNLLLEQYGPQGWWPVKGKYFPDEKNRDEENRYEIIVGAILTQNTAWKNVEKALSNLREKGLIDPDRIMKIDTNKLAELIRPSGYYNQKALRLKEVTENLLFYIKTGKIPKREELLIIRGIGPETADSILLYAFHYPIFVVDAYTRRLLIRIGLCKFSCSYDDAQNLFMSNLPRDEKLFNEYHALIVKHGKDLCKKNPLCRKCILKEKSICPK